MTRTASNVLDDGSVIYINGAEVTNLPVVTFACIGDFGSDTAWTRGVAAYLKSWSPQFIITVGDNNYPAGSAATIDKHIGV